ncbi:uncharacterized protein LOC127718312 [Mytilus californianus]|uniref:uncharacterized protein LOC127718312 n=1 Tax=Mytilus californianus TaxID=6549 RepID=UPI0022461777|nr:uncharacterized protein LOC127718312 [Mytilus californianus]
MLVIYIILILSFSDKGTSLKGLKVCEDTQRNIEYCCSGYEDINGTCTECKIGFMSIGGNSCTHCPNNRFGERCVNLCNCNQNEERCDHMNGCVQKFEVGENVNYTTRAVVGNHSESMTVFELNVLIFWAAIFGVLVMIGGCLGFTCFCKKRNKINAIRIIGENGYPNVSVNAGHNAFQLTDDTHVASSSYLQVINGSYGTIIDNSGNEDHCRHLNSYVTVVPTTSDTHHYMNYE